MLQPLSEDLAGILQEVSATTDVRLSRLPERTERSWLYPISIAVYLPFIVLNLIFFTLICGAAAAGFRRVWRLFERLRYQP